MLPRHVAIIMDGNGRWASKRFMPRIMGHRAGVKSVRKAIDFCVHQKIEVLSLFALSVENFQSRPETEVQFLVSLLMDMLAENLDEMHRNHICIRIMGNLSVFETAVQDYLQHVQNETKNNNGLVLVLAINYSGRWDIFQASQRFAQHIIDEKINPLTCTEKEYSPFLCLSDLPEPDLLIRTSGEKRISNFMLWQFAYTELCFIDAFWPEFDENIFASAIEEFQKRNRRFGRI